MPYQHVASLQTGSPHNHALSYHPSAKSRKISPTAQATESPSISCGECGQVFADIESLWQHRLQCHPMSVRICCDTCEFQASNPMELKSHVRCSHGRETGGDQKPFSCLLCDKSYSSQLGLNHHLIRHSEGGPPKFKCPYRGCETVLSSREAQGKHVKLVHMRNHSQNISGGSDGAINTSITPTVMDTKGELFSCDFPRCRRTFKESKTLRIHKMQHTDEKPLKCKMCDYSCKQRNSLNWHMKSRHGLEKKVSGDGKTIYV